MTNSGNDDTATNLRPYEVLEVEDVSFSSAKRLVYRVQFPENYPEIEALRIAESIVDTEHIQGNDDVNAVGFFFYFVGDFDSGDVADGSIDWAPGGVWTNAITVSAGDYSTFQFATQFYHAEGNPITLALMQPQIVSSPAGNPDAGIGWDIRGESGESELALAEHLVSLGENAVKFGAWWCPHCHTQKELFGEEAFEVFARYDVPTSGYVECANNDRSTPTPQCALPAQQGLVQAFPTWLINGQILTGAQNLENLADASGYTGPRNFLYTQG